MSRETGSGAAAAGHRESARAREEAANGTKSDKECVMRRGERSETVMDRGEGVRGSQEGVRRTRRNVLLLTEV